MKTIRACIILLIILDLSFSSCTSTPPEVSFDSLLTNPEKYNGKTIITEGIYIHGWEWSLLVESVTFSVKGDVRELQGVGQSIWFTGEMPREVYDKLYKNTTSGAGVQYFGKIRVTGKFEYGGQYGHLGSSKYQITSSKVELLEWPTRLNN